MAGPATADLALRQLLWAELAALSVDPAEEPRPVHASRSSITFAA